MSLIKKTDVKNHLSARHRTEIHLAEPNSDADATSFPHEESAGKHSLSNDSVVNPLNIPTPREPEAVPIIISKRVQA